MGANGQAGNTFTWRILGLLSGPFRKEVEKENKRRGSLHTKEMMDLELSSKSCIN